MTSHANPAAADHSSRAREGAGTFVLNIGVFMAVFALVCAVIRIPAPLEDVPGVGPKYAFFAEHRDQYNVLFLGSSRVFHHFRPKEFDKQVREQTGVHVNSFNLGYDGMWPPESFYTLRQVLDLRPPNLRWVLIDLIQINPRINAETEGTLRMAYWHDWHHTVMAWAALRRERLSSWKKFAIGVTHAENLVKRWTNAGRSAEWLNTILRVPDKKRLKRYKWEETNGYEPGLDRVMAGEELRTFEQQVGTLRTKLTVAKLRPEMRDAVVEIAGQVRAAGAEPIFVLAPTLDRREMVSELPSGVELFSFANPRQYPDLYDAANHYDAWHLNEAGARLFTEHLATRFSEALKPSSSAGNSAGAKE